MTPFEAVGKFPQALFQLAESRERENRKFPSRGKPRFSIGDVAGLKVQNTAWRKGTLKKFTNEVYRITRVHKTTYKYVYTVETMDGEKVLGQLDGHMLKVAAEQDAHKVQILDERVRKGKREILVHWDGCSVCRRVGGCTAGR